VKLYAKLEAFNPLGSVKDRIAAAIIEDAEQRGVLRPGQTVIEATSGNTGIGLAMVCAARGYPLVVVMAENFSVERRRLMRFLGAKVVLTPAWKKGTGMLQKAVELAETHGWFLCRQFENEANAQVHAQTTAQEILADFAGERLDYWVTGAGTGGTLKGVGRVLREQRPDTKIIVCEPDNSPLLGSGIPQPRGSDGALSMSHPLFRPHLVQGWAPDFIAPLTSDALADGLVDRVLPIGGDDALRLSRELAAKEGIFTGISGGATLAGALEVCRSAPEGAIVLCMLPDTGERYLSTPLFDSVSAEMSAEELAISRSTPGHRFDETAPAAPAASVATDTPTGGEDFVRSVLSDAEKPVVLFAFAWCEFSWSVRKLFAHCKIPYRAVDLDSVEMQRDDLGARVRGSVGALVGSPTIPQVFVGGQHVGGATEVLQAYESGHLQTLLHGARVSFDEAARVDPRTLLPGWLVAR
jgi:cysteine synthase A